MPRHGPAPKQFSQAGLGQPGLAITGQPSATDPDRDTPDWDVPTTELYLNDPATGNASSGSISIDQIYPDFLGDFESYYRATSSGVAQSIDISWQGRLGTFQDVVSQVRLFIRGDDAGNPTDPPEYRVRVYTESATSNPTFSTTITPASTLAGVTEVFITGSSIVEQPGGNKRYHVVVEVVTLNSGQTLDVSRPLVVQE